MFKLVTPGAGPILTSGASYEQTWKMSTRRCCIPNIKALRHPVSEKKNIWASLFLCSKLVIPGAGPVLTPGASMKKLGRGPQGDAIYQISKLWAFQFQGRRILKFSCFFLMFQHATPGAGPVLITGASYEQTW